MIELKRTGKDRYANRRVSARPRLTVSRMRPQAKLRKLKMTALRPYAYAQLVGVP